MFTSVIQGGRSMGMQLMEDALMALVEAKRIAPPEAYMKATNKRRFEGMVKEGSELSLSSMPFPSPYWSNIAGLH
jgi:hypothetical protein